MYMYMYMYTYTLNMYMYIKWKLSIIDLKPLVGTQLLVPVLFNLCNNKITSIIRDNF